MKRLSEELTKKILVMDGAMGTRLMEAGVRPEDCFDAQNLCRPKLIAEIHRAYVAAGADIIETNTFGASRLKLMDYKLEDKVKEINQASVALARQAAGDKAFVAGSIGPLGQLLEPFGEISFDQAVEIYAEQAAALVAGGVDLFCVETISDLQEMRAAVLAIKEKSSLPIIASLTYDEGEKTVYGTTPEAAAVVLEALGVSVLAANCSTGPEGLLKVAKRLTAATRLPVMVMPNAGMPALVEGRAVYKMTPAKFAAFVPKFVAVGVRIIGGCCGTTPEHIAAVRKELDKQKVKPLFHSQLPPPVRFASRGKVVECRSGFPLLVGERLNPTGRPKMQAELKSGSFRLVREDTIAQTAAGADLLDVNVAIAETVESELMGKVVKVVQTATSLPLSIDSPNRFALEEGLKQFCGRALLNSVNGKKESLESILPLAVKYGAAVIALALDEKGIPQSVGERVRIVERIVQTAKSTGLPKEQIFVDCLVMTAGVGIAGCLETLKAIPLIKEQFGVKTILGISNVSHGLPNRSLINALYLRLALASGLDAAIIDPTDPAIKSALKAQLGKKVLTREALLRLFKEEVERARRSGAPAEKKKESLLRELKYTKAADVQEAVINGDAEATATLISQALAKKINPQKLIDNALIPGMEVVGKKFSRKEVFLPQVLASAEALKAGFDLCQAKIPKVKGKSSGKIMLATVKGDIHDIGKNIVKMLLENHGFTVIDLGKDVPPETILAAAKKERPSVIALSALLTTTMVEMGVVREQLAKAGLDIPLLVGGAVVTPDYAKKIGAAYSADAVGAVAFTKKIIKAAK